MSYHDDDDELNDFDDSAPALSASSTRRTPGRSLSNSARYARTGTATSSSVVEADTGGGNENLWQPNPSHAVDQSVNLMDAESSQYEEKAVQKRGLLGSNNQKQKSLVDVFLADDRGNSRGGYAVKDMASDDVYYHGRSQRAARRWRCLLLLVFVGLLVTGLYLRFSPSDNHTDKKKKPVQNQAPKEQEEQPAVQETEPPEDMAQEDLVDHVTPEEISEVPQTNRLDALRYFIRQQEITDDADLDDFMSYAHRAMVWIADMDKAGLGIPGFDLSDRRDRDEAEKELLERYAIASLFYSITSGNKPATDGASDEEIRKRGQFDNEWLKSDEHICYWHGIVCDKEDLSTVTELRLADHLLDGTLSREIFIVGAMPHLTTVDLAGNRIHGEFPDVAAGRKMMQELGLHSVAPLKYLFLQANQLTGDLVEMMELANLESLDLSGNALTGAIPRSIVDFTSLKELRLGDNKFEGYLTDSFVALTSLTLLNVKGNAFHGEIPVGMYDMTTLEALVLSENEFDKKIPTSFGTLTNLTRLFLDGNRFTGPVPTELGQLTALEEMRVSNNQLTGEIPENLCTLVDDGPLKTLVADCTSGDIVCDCCSFCV